MEFAQALLQGPCHWSVRDHFAAESTKDYKPTFRDLIPEHLHNFEDIFSKESFDELPKQCKWDHAIELECDVEGASTRKVYPMSPEEQKEMDAFIEEALSTGHIRPSKLPIGAPVFFIKKKDGRLRFQ
jgi:hypothetical protein